MSAMICLSISFVTSSDIVFSKSMYSCGYGLSSPEYEGLYGQSGSSM